MAAKRSKKGPRIRFVRIPDKYREEHRIGMGEIYSAEKVLKRMEGKMAIRGRNLSKGEIENQFLKRVEENINTDKKVAKQAFNILFKKSKKKWFEAGIYDPLRDKRG